MIQTGIVGYGFSAQTFHLPLLQACERFNLHGISTRKTALLNEKHPKIQTFRTPLELMHDPLIDLIVITSPNDSHYGLARQSLEFGKHVILEKPMVCSSEEGRSLIALAKEKGLLLSVFHNRRWDGDFLTAKKLLQDGLLGEVRYFESHFDRFRPCVRDRWRERPGAGAGMWYDLGAHLVDQALCLFGLPTALTARILATRDQSQAQDYFHVLFHYENCEIILHSSSYSAGPNCRFHIQGSGGSYIKYGLDPQEMQLKSGVSPYSQQFGKENQAHFGTLYTEKTEKRIGTDPGSYLSYFEQFADSIDTGSALPVTGAEGLQVIRLIELAEKSSLEGRTIQIN